MKTWNSGPIHDLVRQALGPLFAAMASVLALSSCATTLTPLQHSMPAARAALLPEYRVFYDALEDYGDWTLIEPIGYVFRPRVDPARWQPYDDGFWVPTDLYGWVWVSGEPFAWATYHYGRWFRDDFQGWVWVPGVDWAPAWVDWRATDSYVGWAPLAPSGVSEGSVPGGAFRYVPVSQLGSTNIRSYTMSAGLLGNVAAESRPVENPAGHEGVSFNRGPNVEWVERRAGPLPRARIEDLLGLQPGEKLPKKPDHTPDSAAAVREAAAKAASEVRSLTRVDGKSPRRLSMVRPFGVPKVSSPSPEPRPEPMVRPKLGRKKPAAPDSTR